ncbi:MAG: hypothetical protein QOF78_2365 [Phycisphaerales bacterium]|jgi:hypothetical protein|nr:hypothetical protein [Phycisphaerales bacterium]
MNSINRDRPTTRVSARIPTSGPRGWFLLPRPWLDVDATDVLERQAIACGGAGDQYVCEYLHRVAGDPPRVYVKGTLELQHGETIRLGYWHQLAVTNDK